MLGLSDWGTSRTFDPIQKFMIQTLIHLKLGTIKNANQFVGGQHLDLYMINRRSEIMVARVRTTLTRTNPIPTSIERSLMITSPIHSMLALLKHENLVLKVGLCICVL